MEITFENLPKALSLLSNEVSEIKRLLLSKSNESVPETDQLLTVQDAAKFLTLSVPTVYSLISKNALPCMKRSKRVYFSKIELINYLKQGKKKTVSELAVETDNFLSKKKEVRNA
ncbi:helix-turn-helix domain-containing protein [Ferruginibacter lapsinanis]|uniref:helix-turn-helix domain-containing protein n=1 Tax=Ferruginibacter lapsinanis TaxID=563172 RepID=UPI001E315ADC|nr:helix-turn-helix domain-containing protein [Ferruginibacter lapsinanis]UEG50873.1 helix-turn-helix domain-containing protein [Ferruginibacter lapsinanis]